MAQYVPLINRASQDEPRHSSNAEPLSDPSFCELDLEKADEPPLSWYRLPKFSRTLRWKASPDIKTPSTLVISYLIAVLPRFLRSEGWRQEELHPIAWLDGLRGLASLSVYHFHTYAYFVKSMTDVPFVFGLLNGRAMVQVFFVISGYAVSVRILKLMRHSHDLKALLRALASSSFRRWFRLFASAGFASLVMAMFVNFGLLNNEGLRKETLWAQLWDWLCDFIHLGAPFAPIDGFWHEG